jgi:hypothetical protein
MMFRTMLREVTALQLRGLGRWHKVFNARQPLTVRDDLPYIKIWTPDDGGDGIGIRGGPYHGRPTCDLTIQIVIEGAEDEENALLLDEMCEAVIHHLVESPTWIQHFNQITSINTTIESNTEGEMRTLFATITMAIEYEEVFVTRIPDTLDRLQVTLPIPGQPTVPVGESENAIEVPIEFKAPSVDHHERRLHRRPLEKVQR